MDGQNKARLEQLDGTDGIVGTQCVVVANRQDRQVEPFLADQGRIAEQSGVRRVIELDPSAQVIGSRRGFPRCFRREARAVECQG